MTPIIAILLVVGFFVFGIVFAFYSNKRMVERMKATAAELGYEFELVSAIPGAGQGTQAPDISSYGSSGTSPSPGAPPSSAASFLSNLFATWRIRGREGDEGVSIYTVTRGSGKSRTTYTVTEMSVHPREGGDFAISKEGFFSKLGKAVFGLQDIEAGDREFDDKARVKGKDPDAVKRLLDSGELRRAIVAALDAYPGIAITGSRIVYERQGVISKADYYRPLVAAMSAVAGAMRG